jgi:diguanylate cyclase (GGDEF)-like protein
MACEPALSIGSDDSAAARGSSIQPATPESVADRCPPGDTWRTLRPLPRCYVGSVIALGAGAIMSSAPSIVEQDVVLFASLATLSVVFSIAKVNLPIPRSVSTLSVCYVLDFTILLLLGRPAATLTASLSAWTQCAFRRRQPGPMYQALFSAASLALTVQATGFTYWALGGSKDLLPFPIEASIAAAAVFFVVNSGLVAAAVALSTRQSVVSVWTRHYLWSWPGYLLGFVIATAAATGIGRSGLWLLPFGLVSLALTYENFRAYVARLTESATDALTELPNVRGLRAYVAQELVRSRRDCTPLAFLLIDLNDFKSINDTYGHGAGDLALRQVARVIQQSIRPYDMCARYGGDEFVVVMPGCDVIDAHSRALAACAAVSAIHCEPMPGVELALSISVGSAVFPAEGASFDHLLAAADRRMFRNKARRSGKFLFLRPLDASRASGPREQHRQATKLGDRNSWTAWP